MSQSVMKPEADPELCPVCAETTAVFETGTVLGRHRATFRRCQLCGTVFAENPYWLHEAYEQAIAAEDLGLVSRNVWLSQTTALLIRSVFPNAASFVDFGAGNGMFVRLMRDSGFDFRYFDSYGPNLFAAGNEVQLDGSIRFDMATGFEILEHLRHPTLELKNLAFVSESLFFTTTCLPDPPPSLNGWWYYSLGTGQHITFYTPRALDILAEQLGLRRVSRGIHHLLTRKRVRPSVLRCVTSRRLSYHVNPLIRRPTLLPEDYERLTGLPLT